jgi:hypothetical protein
LDGCIVITGQNIEMAVGFVTELLPLNWGTVETRVIDDSLLSFAHGCVIVFSYDGEFLKK